MKSLPSFSQQRPLFLVLIVAFSFLICQQACKKTEFVTKTDRSYFTDNFFAAKSTLHPIILNTIGKLKQQNEKRNFVNALPTDRGLPMWDKMKILKPRQSAAKGDSASEGFTIIPFTTTGLYLDAILVAVPIPDSSDYDVTFYSSTFLYGFCHKTSKNIPEAENLLGLFMMMENAVFGRTDFYHVPIDIFPTNARVMLTDSTKIASLTSMDNEEGGGGGSNIMISGCSIVPSGVHHPNEEGACDWQDQCEYCSAIYCIFETPQLPAPPTGGGGSGGGGGGGTGGSGGGNGGGGGGGGGTGGGTCTGCPEPPSDCRAPFYIEDPCEPETPIPTEPPGDTIFNPCPFSKFLDTSQLLRVILQDLKSHSDNHVDTSEYGYIYEYNPLVYGTYVGDPGKKGVDFAFDGQVDGISHNHYINSLSIFSPDDLWTYATVFLRHQIKDSTRFCFSLVTESGPPYVLLIENLSKFRKFAAKYVQGSLTYHKDANRSFYKISETNTVAENERRFLQYLVQTEGGTGLRLFRGNATFSQWTRLGLDNNNNTITDPCP